MNYRIILWIVFLIFFPLIFSNCIAWNEEQTSNLGPVNTTSSLSGFHSSYHYDLMKVLAIKAGLSQELTETIARYSALVDQINPKNDYPYPLALNSISIPDTFTNWNESLAGTERGNPADNNFNEKTAIYWHFPFRDSNDVISGPMIYGIYPRPGNISYRQNPYFWRVPLSYNLTRIRDWALYGGGTAGKPDNQTPVDVFYYNTDTQQYELIEPNSVQAFGIYLHSLGDSYSHEFCMVNDTIRSHPPSNDVCGLTYHTNYEYAYDESIYAGPHADGCIQATWRALLEYKRINNIDTPVEWTIDNNGFQDGDGIPDNLEDNGDSDHTDSFLERWKSPTHLDLNNDGVIDHNDHTTWRIKICNEALNSLSTFNIQLSDGWNIISSNVKPLNVRISNVLQNVQNNLIVAKDNSGNLYYPLFNINTIGNWKLNQGYMVYMSSESVLSIEGEELISNEYPVNLNQGWNIISYLPDIEMSPEIIFNAILDNLVIVKDNSGGIFFPSFNINTIGNLRPGQGYMIYMSSGDTLLFP